VSLAGFLGTAVVFGTEIFFSTIGRAASRIALPSAGIEIIVLFHLFSDVRTPIWGVSAILSNLLLVVLRRGGERWFYLASLQMVILFVILYNVLSKPINLQRARAHATKSRFRRQAPPYPQKSSPRIHNLFAG
jgi:hypothetical protein